MADVDRLRCSVVVPAYNASATLANCLDALTHQTVDAGQVEILVVDDGSTDRTAAIAEGFGVRLVRLEANRGRIVARRTGAERATCELLVFCDSRVICEPTVLESALRLAEAGTWPLMMGSDFPEDYQGLFGKFYFGIYRRVWPGNFPLPLDGSQTLLTAENFPRVPKGMGVFACPRDFFLRHQPAQTDRHVSDDTLLFQSMVDERPIVRTSALRCHYVHRTRIAAELRHLLGRGTLFNSFYLRPGQRYFAWYLLGWAVLTGLIVAVAAGALPWWLLPAAAGAAWLAAAAWLAYSPLSLAIALLLLPPTVAAFGAGILRGHIRDALKALRGR